MEKIVISNRVAISAKELKQTITNAVVEIKNIIKENIILPKAKETLTVAYNELNNIVSIMDTLSSDMDILAEEIIESQSNLRKNLEIINAKILEESKNMNYIEIEDEQGNVEQIFYQTK